MRRKSIAFAREGNAPAHTTADVCIYCARARARISDSVCEKLQAATECREDGWGGEVKLCRKFRHIRMCRVVVVVVAAAAVLRSL